MSDVILAFRVIKSRVTTCIEVGLVYMFAVRLAVYTRSGRTPVDGTQ